MEFAEQIDLDGFLLDKNSRPFLVGELSGNHNNDLERAKKLIDAAKEAKVDAIKLQTYSADTITIKSDLDDISSQCFVECNSKLCDKILFFFSRRNKSRH